MKRNSRSTLPDKILRMKPRYSVAGMAALTGKPESWIRQVACHSGISLAEKRIPWSKDEDEALIKLISSGITRRQVAEKLGRKFDSVRGRILWLRKRGRLA